MLKLKTGKTGEAAAEAAVMESRRKGCPLPCHKKQNTTEREHISIVLSLSEMGADDLKNFRDYCADHNNASALALIDAIIIKNASAEKGN